ncbi:MAG: N-glycosylase/DNA lyase [Candidatus Micrarchaeota archaeon]
MDGLANKIDALRKTPLSRAVSARLSEFLAMGDAPDDALFKELCFCLLTANYTSEGGIRIQKAIGDGFLTLEQDELAASLKSLGYRFPNTRARYIAEARRHSGIRSLLASAGGRPLRDHLADTVLGLGFKESSHFLRNIGYMDYAIIDFHVIDVLAEHNLIVRPKSKSLSRKKYLEIERVLGRLSKRLGMSQGELDLYLWYMETGKVLK